MCSLCGIRQCGIPFHNLAQGRKLFNAAEKGDEDEIKRILSKGNVCVNYSDDFKDEMEWTPLTIAIECRQVAAVKMLLGIGGIDVEKWSFYGGRPLFLAVKKGYVDIVRLLLEKGANIEAKDWWESTPLSHAAFCGQKHSAKVLVENGADIEARDDEGSTPLVVAAHTGNTEVAEWLISRAKLGTRDKRGCTLLMRAVEGQKRAIVELVLNTGKMDIEATNECGETALLLAVQYKNKHIIKELIKRGANLEAKDNSNKMALLKAAECGNKNVVSLLLSTRKFDVDARDALSLANKEAHEDTVKVIDAYIRRPWISRLMSRVNVGKLL